MSKRNKRTSFTWKYHESTTQICILIVDPLQFKTNDGSYILHGYCCTSSSNDGNYPAKFNTSINHSKSCHMCASESTAWFNSPNWNDWNDWMKSLLRYFYYIVPGSLTYNTSGNAQYPNSPEFTTKKAGAIQQSIPNLRNDTAAEQKNATKKHFAANLPIIDTSFCRFLQYSTKFWRIQTIHLQPHASHESCAWNKCLLNAQHICEKHKPLVWRSANAIRAKQPLPCDNWIMGQMSVTCNEYGRNLTIWQKQSTNRLAQIKQPWLWLPGFFQ